MNDENTLGLGPMRAVHVEKSSKHADESDRLTQIGNKISLARLLTFLASLTLLIAGQTQANTPLLIAGAVVGVTFFALVWIHAKTIEKLRDANARRDVHIRHLQRIDGLWTQLPIPDVGTPSGHPYANDVDLFGNGSLLQRINVTHTLRGQVTLASWLANPSSVDSIKKRQDAVRELVEMADFRENLEVSAAAAEDDKLLDASPFLAFTKRAPTVNGFWVATMYIFPIVSLVVSVAFTRGVLDGKILAVVLLAQFLLVLAGSRQAIEVFQLIAARRGYVEAFQRMLSEVEQAEFSSELLQELRKRVHLNNKPPSEYMARLDRWAGFAEFYTQFPLHFFVNLATFWDLHVLYRLEKWNIEIGQELEKAFDALGRIESLASLATLAATDSHASYPKIEASDGSFLAKQLAHPLLPESTRVANDVTLKPAGVMIVTGSNMAGKSTLLRSVGLNMALTFAGGPVVAKEFRTPPVRLRASMRVDDSLQEGASYFHAELQKLRLVVADAEKAPPIFFLLDELLRGTNAHARHTGARAVLAHLMERGAFGLAATHDIALSKLADEVPDKVSNVHFTDVVIDDEMQFDYTLRDGVVKTSNALRLLAMAGIDLPKDIDPRTNT